MIKYSFYVFIIGVSLAGCASKSSSIKTGEIHYPINSFILKSKSISWKSNTEKNIVMQKEDYSCGSATLATLLNYHFKESFTEKFIMDEILKSLDEDQSNQRRERGFNLLDLNNFAKRRDYISAGVKLDFDSLSKINTPLIVFLVIDGYKHFAVFRGIRNGLVFIADPSRGNIRLTKDEFLKEWSGITLILEKENFKPPSSSPLVVKQSEVNVSVDDLKRMSIYNSF